MCKSCQCEVSGKNPLQEWREMSDACEHMAHGGHESGSEIRFCWKDIKRDAAVSGLGPGFCAIDECPRLKVELPKDVQDEETSFGGVEGIYTRIHRATKAEAQRAAQAFMDEYGKYVVDNEGWIPYKGYIIYIVRLKNVTT